MEPNAAPLTHSNLVARDGREKSIPLAVLLSAMPGLGQIYVGYTTLGFTHVAVIGGLISVLNAGAGGLEPLLGIFLAFYWLYNMIDAGRRAQHFNTALAGLRTDELPAFDSGGTLLGGLVLTVIGLIALLHELFGFSLAWMHRWWPLGLVLIGAYLVYRTLKERGLVGKSDTE